MRRILWIGLAVAVFMACAGNLHAARKPVAARKTALHRKSSRPVKNEKSEEQKCSEKSAVVSVPMSDVFAATSARSERVTEVLLGDEFKVVTEGKDWAYGHIPSQNGYSGWIRKENISFAATDFPKASQFVQVKNAKARITFRDGSFMNVYAGTRLPLVRQEPRRYEVMVPNGSTGFLPSETALIETDTFSKEVTPQDILQASKFYGSEYKWGGITAGGMDCSGFVYTAFRLNGIYLKRDSYLQAEEGRDVPADELNPGDLVFFKSEKANGITHVGIYIGDGNFIHSSRGNKGVAVSRLSEEKFKKEFVAARRILKPRSNAIEIKDNNVQPAAPAGKSST